VVDGVLRVVLDAEGDLVRYLKIVRDIGWYGAGSGPLDAVLNHTPDVIYVRDRRGLCTYANPMTALTLGRNIVEIVGHSFDEIFPPHISARSLRIITAGWKAMLDVFVRSEC
jgi:PAS domain-containing protein